LPVLRAGNRSAGKDPSGMGAMAEAGIIEQPITVNKPGQVQGRDGAIDCEILSLTRRGAQVHLMGVLGDEQDVFLSVRGFGQLACRIMHRDGAVADLRFQGDGETQDAVFQEIVERLGDEEGRRRHLRRSVLWPGTLKAAKGQFACTILNMSLAGAKVALTEAHECGGGVTLLGDRFEGLPATVVWQRGRLIGLQFKNEPAEVAEVLGDLLPAIKSSS